MGGRMLGNLSVHLRHNRAVSRAIKLADSASPRWLAALLVGAALLAAQTAHGARSSCPLTTMISPYAGSMSARYEIVITDGGPGDLDGAVNGSCETALELCRDDSSQCGDLGMDAGKVHASGGSSPAARTLVETR